MDHQKTLYDWLDEAPFTLALSSGFFGFFAHTGFLAALEEAQLKPNIINGCSAGALAGSHWATGLDSQSMLSMLLDIQKSDFWDPGVGLGMVKGKRFRALLQQNLLESRIENCATPLRLSLHNVLKHRTEVFAHGDLASAVHASCAVPIMFHPVWIKRNMYVDGGVFDGPALEGCAADERVLYHHLISRKFKAGKHTGNVTKDPRPTRDNMATIAVPELPILGPDALSDGKRAYQIAKDYLSKALEHPAPI